MNSTRPREALPDVLRALALVSVLVVNAIGYASAPWGSPLGSRIPPDSAWAAATQGLVAALLQGKGYTVLAFVFGMSLWLSARRHTRTEALQRGRVRNRRLLGLGIVHGVFVYFGDILTLYALVGRRLLGRLHLPWGPLRRHLRRALGWAILAKLVLAAIVVGLPDPAGQAGEATLSTVQGWWPFLKLNAGAYTVVVVAGLLVSGPVIYLCMACGVAAARLRLLTHPRWRPWLRRCLLRWGPPLMALSLAHGWAFAVTVSTDGITPWLETFGDLLTLPVTAACMAALALASAGGSARWCQGLVPMGQRTLTLYVGHSLVCLVLFSGAGLALALTNAQTVLFSLGLWLLAWVAAKLGERQQWPLERWIGRR
jgi:uncharacterized protein